MQQGCIQAMIRPMQHRGPDATGFYTDDDIAFGHLRLSIVDLSDAANQPFEDASGRYRIVFNGEIYNFREVKKQLTGYDFHTSGDTEVLLAAYIKWGASCLQYLKGMFAFAIWDTLEKKMFLARDRMGVKPLYYYTNGDVLLFASEIRGLMGSGLVPRKVNQQAIREFLSYQSVGFPLAIIEDVHQLEAGSYMTVSRQSIETTKYWSVSDRKKQFDFGDSTRVEQRVRELLHQAVEQRMISDVPIGAFLSGGIDSSAVVGLMAESSAAPINTFTIGFDEKDYDESEYAAQIAKKFNTDHSRVLLRPSVFLDELTNALDAMDTPSGDGVNTYVVSKAIKQHGLTVALSGVGGDELFAGYPFFKQYLQLKKFDKLWKLGSVPRHAMAAIYGIKGSNKAERLRGLLTAPSCSIAGFYPEFRRIISPSLINKLTDLEGSNITAVEKNLAGLNGSLHSFPLLSQVSIAEYLGYTQHTLLKDTDQMSMAVSLEVREPFFDHELIEYVLAIPDSYKFPDIPKSLLVRSLKGLLPPEIVHRRKQGFLFPWAVWMKKDLFNFCDQRLKRMAERDFLNGKELLSYWNKFQQGDPSVRWMELWLFVVMEYWLEKNTEV
ncbi:asparagine synthase (glutamine-hydrolyzing) [Pseudoflavitalea sp. G-6-1-2]|nr:asparagine synthase (glutamine-hydrolyzing) [Pseudoflavitalea sp. G-6-1-2]